MNALFLRLLRQLLAQVYLHMEQYLIIMIAVGEFFEDDSVQPRYGGVFDIFSHEGPNL